MSKWMTIDTAPRDGTEIIGWCRGELRVCSWEPLDNPVARQWGIEGTWYRKHVTSGKGLLGGNFTPTHWIHSPEGLLPFEIDNGGKL